MKDNFIEIINGNGEIISCELILKYYDDETKNNYIVYKQDGICYSAKFQDVLGYSNIDSNLSNDELEKIKLILEKEFGGESFEIINE